MPGPRSGSIEEPGWPRRRLDWFQDDGFALATDGDGVSFQAESLGQSHPLGAVGPYDLDEFHRVPHPVQSGPARAARPAVGRSTMLVDELIVPLGWRNRDGQGPQRGRSSFRIYAKAVCRGPTPRVG